MRLASMLAAPPLAAVILAALPAAAAAQTVMPVEKFESVELHGGGTVTIRQGSVQRVTMIRGDRDVAGFDVIDRGQGGKLVISACRGFCMGSHRLEVEIQTPSLNGAAVNGGGHIVAEGAFPAQGAVSAVIHGGGVIDLKAVPAQSASVVIHGGGKIFVTAQNNLAASINGGGSIRYLGQPTVSSSIHGGGTVDSLR